MRWAFESMMTTLLASFSLFLIACILFTNSNRILAVGYRTLTFICILSVVRLILPIEFNFGHNIHLNRILSMIPVFFRKKHRFFNFFSVSLWGIGVIIWIIGIIIHLHKYIKTYRKDKFLIQTFGILVSNESKYRTALSSVCSEYGLNRNFRIYEISGICSPMIFSLFDPIIIFPANNHYTDQEIIFIFRHEIGHFFHHHLLYQFFVHIFVIIYWWNPLNHYIQEQIDALLEMSIDHIFLSSVNETKAYLNCLLNIKKQAMQKITFCSSNSFLSLNNVRESILEKRFQILTHTSQKHYFFSAFVSIVSISIFILSYCFTFRGVGIPAEAKSGEVFSLTQENSYAIVNENGTYDLYLHDQYIETVNSLKGYDLIPIYTTTEDIP